MYEVSVSSTGDKILKGKIKVNVHYFEDGNVQLNTVLEKQLALKVTDVRVPSPSLSFFFFDRVFSFVFGVWQNVSATAKLVVAGIEQMDSGFHQQLEEFYVNMNANTFKAMRRFLPVTRKPMEWNSNAHKLASEIK